ncbi:MAG: excinuclease ABC subunit UvrA [Blastocatellia bacterium]|nr:excinuclease ABC subunit UvrA [Blastocatellia bacterium]
MTTELVERAGAPDAGETADGTREVISVRGARVHNLKNIDFDIPINKMTVVTGVSGSGKSSLAFDTIYAEGQRRYVESLSAYARQFLERMDKPDVDEVTGICPPIAIRQKNSTRNPRSTVATQTEIYDYLRLLYARVGTTICRNCGRVVTRDNPESIADQVLASPTGTRFYVLFPAAAGVPERPVVKPTRRKAAAADTASADRKRITAHLMSLMARGFTRLYRNGEIIELKTPDSYPETSFDNTWVLVDRLVVGPEVRGRLVDSLETCYREGHGQAAIETAGETRQTLTFSERFECKHCAIVYEAPEPRLFSFNNPFGACPTCQGFGNTIGLDLDLVIPNPQKSLAEGAVEPFTKPQYEWIHKQMLGFAKEQGVSTKVPFAELEDYQQEMIYAGDSDMGFEGVRGFFDWLETKKYKLHVRVFLSKYRGYTLCPDCRGGRLRQEARDVKVGKRSLPEICKLAVRDAARFFERLELTTEEMAIADRILAEVRDRLRFLSEVGLDYLSLDRLASTLSGGEAQRIQLATNLGSSLVGALYVLDEPSVGLHPRDNGRLIAILKNLRDIGNTVLVVEHEPQMILEADEILDIGPGAGEHGGELIFAGSAAELLRSEHSLTGKYLRGDLEIKMPRERRKIHANKMLRVFGAREHNLTGIDVEIPLGVMTCITGVSGSGKSTLVHDVIYAALRKLKGEWTGPVGAYSRIEGETLVDEVVMVDQSPIGRTPRSNPVTYIKVYDAIRDVFASTREAHARGFDASHFSFNVTGGRCERCQGNGVEVKEMQFLADVELVCEECKGMRFKSSVLEIRHKGRNIHDVLSMTVREAMGYFSDIARVLSRLQVLDDVGLGYLRLGQSATTLSGGEAQRVKLASYLSRKSPLKTLYIFDEPTTGLHFDDINKLLTAFYRLVDSGSTLIVIEHNLDVIKTADWVIDLGPEGGDAGGEIVAIGPPESIAAVKASHTGRYLRDYMKP